MASKHSVTKKKECLPKPLSNLKAGDAFINHSVLFPEMNSLDSVLSNDEEEVYALTDSSKEAKDMLDVEKFVFVYGLKTGHLKHMLSTTLVHQVNIEFCYSMTRK